MCNTVFILIDAPGTAIHDSYDFTEKRMWAKIEEILLS